MTSLHRVAAPAACCLLLAGLLGGCGNKHRQFGHEIIPAPADTISVYQLASQLRLRVAAAGRSTVSLSDRANSVTVFSEPGSAVYVNGGRVACSGAISAVNGTLFVPRDLVGAIRPHLRQPAPVPPPLPLTPSHPAPASPEGPGQTIGLVVLDAGHGGKDTGAIGCNGMLEKDVVLDVANRVCGLLRSRGVSVAMTRSDDRFIELAERSDFSNRQHPDLFVSIHADSAPNRRACGHTVYIARGANGACTAAAGNISRRLSEQSIAGRGVQQANYRVLVGTTSPAVLVELGYLSNGVEAARLAESSYRDIIAAAIAAGIVDCLPR